MNNKPTPHLQFFFLCDEIVQREDRQIDVSGILSHVLFSDAPLKMPPLQLTTKLAVGIYSADRFRAYALRVVTVEPNGTEAPLHDTQIGLVGDRYTPIIAQTFSLTFLAPGTYWFNAYLDGQLAGQYPLIIEYVPMSQS